MGRLALRVAWQSPGLRITHINDPAGDAATFAHLLNFDSIHGRWMHTATADGDTIIIGDQRIPSRATLTSAIRIGPVLMWSSRHPANSGNPRFSRRIWNKASSGSWLPHP
ncbi:hypothetical protein PEC18_30245 [Paucibacter sp. O1-1]|nr:hypothetical protein [Paucibacter sp. O1-1]MDA3830000.1 hypothetical protein [Paucibacter sp. O1-1]